MMLAIALVLAVCLLALLALGYRIAANVGPLDLEDYARRNHVVYIPVAAELAQELEKGWSKPLRMRLDTHKYPHPIMAELICTTVLEDENV